MASRRNDTVSSIRRFNRFYTRQLGLLEAGFLDTPYSLTEVRVLYELAHGNDATATWLAQTLHLDLGYLSRIITAFTKKGIVSRKRSPADGRSALLTLTAKGRSLFRDLNLRQDNQIEDMLARVSSADRHSLVDSLQSIERILEQPALAKPGAFSLRYPKPGDLGWVIHRQSILYNQEYGWDNEYEAIVCDIAARFIRNYDPKCERCWIAERDGQIIGSIFCVKKSRTVAQLRLLYVEPSARGTGLGTQLVDECIDFARSHGYRKLVLWTNSVLHAARRIYERAGFHLVEEEAHYSFGKDLHAQTWELELSDER